jgi:hypothetical protein
MCVHVPENSTWQLTHAGRLCKGNVQGIVQCSQTAQSYCIRRYHPCNADRAAQQHVMYLLVQAMVKPLRTPQS